MTKKLIIGLVAILVLMIGFLGTLYYLVTHSVDKEGENRNSKGVMGLFFRNPETASPENIITTTTVSGGTTVIQIGTSSTATEALTVIPTSILYVASETPNKVVLSIESVGKTEKGTVLVAIKALTFETSNVTSVDPSNFLALIPPEGVEIRPNFIQGNFTNIAPNGSYAGNAIFSVPAGRNSIILQVGSGQGVVFFEFDFNAKTFRQVDIS